MPGKRRASISGRSGLLIRSQLLGLLLLGACADAAALSLGDLRVRSTIGRAFEAAIPFTAAAEDELTPQCIRGNLDGPSPNDHVPLLANLSFEIVPRTGGGEIIARTRAPVGEPAVRMRLTIDCSPRSSMVREFIVLMEAPSPEALHVPSSPIAAPRPAVPTAQAQPAATTPARGGRARGGATGGSDATDSVVRRPEPAKAEPRALRMDGLAGAASPQRARAGRKPARGTGDGRYRLTLSAPLVPEAELPQTLSLKRSDEILSALAPPRRYEANELEALRVESRFRMAADPYAEALSMQNRLGALESGLAGMKSQLAEISAARRSAEERARRLDEENRRLSERLHDFGVAAAFIACVLLGAFAFWRYRLASENRALRDRSLDLPATETGSATMPVQRPQRAPPSAAESEPDHASTVVMRAPTARFTGTPKPETSESSEEYLPDAAIAYEPPTPAAATVATRSAPPAAASTPRFVPKEARAAVADAPTLHTPVDFSLDEPESVPVVPGANAEEVARRERYLAEFERKLFPEIALGRVKLDQPRSIIALARTYYQEDFDPGKAISFLEYSLFRSAEPMLIHLALLEVLRMERRAREYATVARAFRAQYPDNATHWQLIAAYGRLLDPRDSMYEGEKVPGLDLDTPSNWLGSTLDMTKYVLGQKVSDSVRDLPGMRDEEVS